jgi:hypothetical protein
MICPDEDIGSRSNSLSVRLFRKPGGTRRTPPPLPTPSITKQKLIVGLTLNPPFVIHEPDGSWTGISVELWQEVAKEIGLNYEYLKLTSGDGSTGWLKAGSMPRSDP